MEKHQGRPIDVHHASIIKLAGNNIAKINIGFCSKKLDHSGFRIIHQIQERLLKECVCSVSPVPTAGKTALPNSVTYSKVYYTVLYSANRFTTFVCMRSHKHASCQHAWVRRIRTWSMPVCVYLVCVGLALCSVDSRCQNMQKIRGRKEDAAFCVVLFCITTTFLATFRVDLVFSPQK